MSPNIFFNLTILFCLTVTIAFIIRLLRQPLIVAYLVSGIVAGPLFLNLVDGDQAIFDSFAQFGIVLLLFIVGLNLNVSRIKQIGRVSVIAGLAQAMFTALIGFVLLSALGFPPLSAFNLSVAVTFSSTIIIVKLLTDKKDTETTYGRYTIGLMIVQDIIAILLLIGIQTFAGQEWGMTEGVALFALKAIATGAGVYVLSRFLLPPLLTRIAASDELLFIFTIAWCFSLASLLHVLGFSIEIGAVIAGMSLGSSPFQMEIASRIKPLRDFFIVIFFIILGSRMILSEPNAIILPSILISLFILIGNPLILFFTFRRCRFTRRNSFLAGVTAAQVSEFGFVLLFAGMQAGYVTQSELEIFTLVALITIFASSYIITYNEHLYERLRPFFSMFGKDRHHQKEQGKEVYAVWVIGYHRIGWKICEALWKKNISFAVVDYNPAAITKLEDHGIPAYFGDISDEEFLNSLPLEKASLVIMTVPEPNPQLLLTRFLRKKNKKTIIIANLSHNGYLNDLYRAGASYVMMPHLLGGRWIADVLQKNPWTKHTFVRLREEQRKDMTLRHSAGIH